MGLGKICCLDAGSSLIRFKGDDEEDRWLPNNVCDININTDTRLKESEADTFEDKLTLSLDLTVMKTEGDTSDFFNVPSRFLAGDMAERYSASSRRLSGMKNKHDQKVYFQNVITAIAFNQMINNKEEDDVYLYVALPPIEVKTSAEYVQSQFKGKFQVTFNSLNETININIVEVNCFEESFMALTNFFFTEEGKVREENVKYHNCDILSIDIGAGTTDFVAAHNRRFIEKSGQTYKLGGNVVRDAVADAIRAEYGFDITDEMAEKAVAEGRIRMGMAYKDVSQYVVEAKKEFVGQLLSSMDNYFRSINKPLQGFSAAVLSGGGSMRGEYRTDEEIPQLVVTSESMSKYLWDELQTICDTIDVKYIEEQPRLANLHGLYTRAKFDRAMRRKQANSAKV